MKNNIRYLLKGDNNLRFFFWDKIYLQILTKYGIFDHFLFYRLHFLIFRFCSKAGLLKGDKC